MGVVTPAKAQCNGHVDSNVSAWTGRSASLDLNVGNREDKHASVTLIDVLLSRPWRAKLRGMLRDGLVRPNWAGPARHVTQPQVTQILNLNFRAPGIQEAILFLDGDAAVSGKALRPIKVKTSWTVQRRMWRES